MDAAQAGYGTIFLIQGAPGVGKTALLAECRRVAEEAGWQTARINPIALWDTNTLLKALGHAPDPDQKESTWGTNVEGKAGIPTLGEAAGSGSFESKKIHAARTPLDVLNDGKGALLLTLDEAQTVSEKIPSEHHPLSKVVLDSLHNGDVDRPVVLAAGGLSMTREVFRGMGVSRFEAHSFVGLGRMRNASVRKVVRDWLIQEGGANGEPAQWVDAIAPETYGWPQHIVSYIRPAVWHLVANSGEMTRDGLQKVLEEGRKQCAEFYEARSDGLHKKVRRCIAYAAAHLDADGDIDDDIIMDSLRKKIGKMEAQKMFKLALNKGVLDNQGGGLHIPIPSMRYWYLDNYLERDQSAEWLDPTAEDAVPSP